jgi:hypothetical protein
VATGAFRATDPLLTHVALVGALMYLRAAQSVRQRVARAAGLPPASDTPADLARVVGDIFLHGLEARPVASAPPTRKRTGGAR